MPRLTMHPDYPEVPEHPGSERPLTAGEVLAIMTMTTRQAQANGDGDLLWGPVRLADTGTEYWYAYTPDGIAEGEPYCWVCPHTGLNMW